MIKSLLTLAILASSSAHAGFLRMAPQLKAEVDSATSQIVLTGEVQNQGDETSLDVKVEVIPTAETSVPHPKLGPNESANIKMKVATSAVGLEAAGLYYLPVRILYRDMNSYPFSAVQMLPVSSANDSGTLPTAPLEVRIAATEFEDHKISLQGAQVGKINLRNLTTEELKGRIKLYGPRELEILTPSVEFVLPPNGESSVQTSIENKSGLVNSNYALYAMAEGTIASKSGRQHFSEVASFQVAIQAGNATSPTGLSLVGLAVLVLVIAALVAWSKGRKRAA